MIRKRGNRYGVRVTKRGKQEWVGTFDKLQDARDAERKAELRTRPTSRETCDSFASRWLDDFRPDLRGTTRYSYSRRLQQFSKRFKGIRLADVERQDARDWAVSRPRVEVAVVRTMFNDARAEGLTDTNPFERLRLPASKGRKHLRPLTTAQLDHLADTALSKLHGQTIRAMILFAGYTGARPGEMFALKWTDLKGDEARIERAADQRGGVGPTKTGEARTIYIPPPAMQAIRAMPRRTAPWVFTTATGRRFRHARFNDHWFKVREAAGMEHVELYDLRHAAATHLLELGLPQHDVGQQLGHTDGGWRVSVLYGHPQRSAIGRLRAAFSEETVPLRSVANGEQQSTGGQS